MTKSTPTFSDKLSQLETLVNNLEQSELSLEDALKIYEKAIKLTRQCQQQLTQAEKKVKVLSEQGTLDNFDSNQ